MNFETLLVEDRGPVRVVSINRPKALNALNAQVVGELTELVEETAISDSVRALVLTGAGEKAFVAGALLNAHRAASTMSVRA